MGWQNFVAAVFRAGQTTIINAQGEFQYSGVPALGNLYSSDTKTAGTDKYGNAYLAGKTTYVQVGANFFALQQNGLSFTWYQTINAGGPWNQQDTISMLFSLLTPRLLMQNGDFQLAPGFRTVASDPSVGPPTFPEEPWHSLGTLAGFTVTVARYRMTAELETELDIIVTGGGANAASVQFSNIMPAAYALGNGQTSSSWPLTTNKVIAAGDILPRVVVTSGGAVLIVSNANRTDPIWGGARIPTN